VDPRAGLDDVEKRKLLTLPGLELRPLGRYPRSQSVYRLSYPRSNLKQLKHIYLEYPVLNNASGISIYIIR
jgi:hypothetical protein